MPPQVNLTRVKEGNTYCSQTIPKIIEKGWLPNSSLQGQHYPDTKPAKDITEKEKFRSLFTMNMDAKILNKMLTNQIQPYFKKIIYHDQVGFTSGMQGWFNIHKSMNVIHQIKKRRIDAEKAFDKF